MNRHIEGSVPSMNYEDVHLNVFWPYGSHAYWENNLTAALAKFLFNSNPSLRRRFVADCLALPKGADSGDFRVLLQQKPTPADLKKRYKMRSAVLVQPRRFFVDITEQDTKPGKATDHTTPDLLLVNDDTGTAVIVEVKLWEAAAKEAHQQIRSYARRFGCKGRFGKVEWEEVYSWLSRVPTHQNHVSGFLRESLLAYLEDLGCSDLPSFRLRHVSTDDGSFVYPELFKRRITPLLESLNSKISRFAAMDRVKNFSRYDYGEDIYAAWRFRDTSLIGDLQFGFHADSQPPSVYAMSFLEGNASKIDAIINSMAPANGRQLKLNWLESLNGAPNGFTITFKKTLYHFRSPKDQKWPYEYQKIAKSRWRKFQNSNSMEQTALCELSSQDVIEDLHALMKRWHRHKIRGRTRRGNPQSTERWLVTLILEMKGASIPFRDLAMKDRNEILERMADHARELHAFYATLKGK